MFCKKSLKGQYGGEKAAWERQQSWQNKLLLIQSLRVQAQSLLALGENHQKYLEIGHHW